MTPRLGGRLRVLGDIGQPSEEMLAALKQQAGGGVETALNTEHLGGFIRASSQD